MDLTRAARGIAVGVVAASVAVVAGCDGGNPASFSPDALVLPASLKEALPLADAIARKWNPDAYLAGLGGDYSVADSTGRSVNQSFVYYARFGPYTVRKLTVELINGAPWTQDDIVGTPPRPFPDRDFIDSDEAIRLSIQLAEQKFVPTAQAYAARLLCIPVYPEPGCAQMPTALAWRVDFLELDDGPQGTPVWWSLARFYLDPWPDSAGTAQFLDIQKMPILPNCGQTSREIYPTLPLLP